MKTAFGYIGADSFTKQRQGPARAARAGAAVEAEVAAGAVLAAGNAEAGAGAGAEQAALAPRWKRLIEPMGPFGIHLGGGVMATG